MKISFICTVYNEQQTIEKLLVSLTSQSKQPDEIIFVDGGSIDKTMALLSKFQFKLSRENVKILVKEGNRSVGRNEAITHATGDIIVCSDAGCILDKDWIKNITEPFKNERIDVVAGYYDGLPQNVFQKALVPYVLVMPDKLNVTSFLPASRSMAFRKQIWEKVGKFDEILSHNEDYAFAIKLMKTKAKMVFTKDAIVHWIPRSTLKEAMHMFYRFAYGDAEAGIFRWKVPLIFIRYLYMILLLGITILNKSVGVLVFLLFFVCFYILWAIQKNYRYVQDWRALYYLPLLQLSADIMVMVGTIRGILKRYGLHA